ncbi:MAG: hypothetical protein Fur0044_28750 [Anaerolineae bacterium]|nr:hypothetical protein [Anaerolineales bacterium]MCQ3973274.1 hypothetical protein [Anaerolineae bacterium]
MNRLILITVGVVSVLLLAGAVYLGVRLMNEPEEGPGSKGEVMVIGQKGGAGPVSFSLDIQPAPELPQTPPEVNGLFVRREDNSIFVGTGEIKLSVMIDQATGERQSSSSYSGPVLEVVVTRETTIYRDETGFLEPGQAGGGKQTIQQVVKPVDSLEALGENTKNTEIQAWGTRSGDRVVAQVLVYRLLKGG